MVPPGRRRRPLRRAARAGGARLRRARRAPPAVLRRAAAADQHREGARARAGSARRRRAGLRARRVGAGDGAQPARGPAREARADDLADRPQHGRRAPRLRPRGRDVPGADRRDRARLPSSSQTRAIPIRRDCCRRCRGSLRTAGRRRPRSSASHRARFRCRAAAVSTLGARSPRSRSARRRIRLLQGQAPRTWPPATSPGASDRPATRRRSSWKDASAEAEGGSPSWRAGDISCVVTVAVCASRLSRCSLHCVVSRL